MSKETFSVFERSLSYIAEPELIAKGLSYAEARDLAGSKIGEFISRWSCNFEIKREARDNGETILEAVKPIEGSSLSWGYRVTIKPEPDPKAEENSILSEFGFTREGWNTLQREIERVAKDIIRDRMESRA